MRHFPIFLDLAGRRVVLAGGGAEALAKLRLLLKTEARLTVFAAAPDAAIEGWASEGRLRLVRRAFAPGDALCAALAYAATGDDAEDARVAGLARADGALVNLVDNLAASQFITPAIVDRDPVVVAIGTEGAAPVLARQIKRWIEGRLAAGTGALARAGQAFRGAATALPRGAPRRAFWEDWYAETGPAAVAAGRTDLQGALASLLSRHLSKEPAPGRVMFVGAGPGDPELLTLRARKALDAADVVVTDRLVPPAILELARREAEIVHAGKQGFGPSMPQAEIDRIVTERARGGALVVRLKSGDPAVFGRLDEEIAACEAAGVSWQVVPGIPSASAAAASLGQSLTRRGRNSDVRLVTGHDTAGFAEQDWRALARPGAVAAVYMAKRAARFLQGRLMMHGAAADTPVSVVENASRPGERVFATTLSRLAEDLEASAMAGPALLMLGLEPRHSLARGSVAPATATPHATVLQEHA
jgi:uroporphyrin-III C-methyltransferase/precorrin-2 dehydrogenase/sirohydrochlorin ferrochelatase